MNRGSVVLRTALVGAWAVGLWGSVGAVSVADELEPRQLMTRANEAYASGRWAECAADYSKASIQSRTGVHETASYNSACCFALAGDPDRAFTELVRSIEGGFRDVDQIKQDSDLASLRDDRRWFRVVHRAELEQKRYRERVNAELLELFEQDQSDRRGGRSGSIDWSEVGPRDEKRRARVAEIMASGGATIGDDYYHAAMVFQHGKAPEDYKQAHEWALEAVELGFNPARWLAAASEDRYLMNLDEPQKYGTQFRRIDDRWVLWKVDPSVTDAERAEWDVPPLQEAEDRAAKMNAP